MTFVGLVLSMRGRRKDGLIVFDRYLCSFFVVIYVGRSFIQNYSRQSIKEIWLSQATNICLSY